LCMKEPFTVVCENEIERIKKEIKVMSKRID
jgi:hypothetical protein